MIKFPKYRIIYVEHDGDPCHWQLQERCWLFFWKNACGNVSSATTAANEILFRLRENKRKSK
jgi:hypothetical protein|tara:strand:+ start:962 stop:1147 length:186 start_codon:yes stop_codon:yes gene_type:complete